MTERIALISDIHGNIPAFEAVLDDLDRRGIDRVFNLGDVAGKGPDGAKTVDIVRERGIPTVRGNWDEGLSQHHDVLRWYQDELGPERCAWLGALPFHIDLVLGGTQVRLVHASPQGTGARVRQDDSTERHLAMFENTPETGDGPEPDLLAYGDIHCAFIRCFRHRTLVNVGSVGNSLDLPLACYAILEADPNAASPGLLTTSLVRVPYDIERAIADAAAVNMPDLEAYANELRTARYRYSKVPA